MSEVAVSLKKKISVSCAYTQGKREQFSGFNRTLDAINNVFRKFSAFHDETGRMNVDGMNIISNDGSNKRNRSRKARISYKVQRTINASLNGATSTRAVSSNPNFVTRHIFCQAEDGIRDRDVTGVQTCALPISIGRPRLATNGRALDRFITHIAIRQIDDDGPPPPGASTLTTPSTRSRARQLGFGFSRFPGKKDRKSVV